MVGVKNILIIEDDFFIRDLYQKQFTKEGYAVDTAEDAEIGLEKVRSGQANLILLDIMLPKMSGLDLLKILKAEAALQNIPVVMLTNLGQDNAIKQAFDLGAEGYLVKSAYTPTQVVQEVKGYIK
ncbi:MAG: hypothetical protein A3F33_00925 [Candidatus Woykebacteria bacterium RIFCSPHIGHO2_12_FULL_43_10]|uniref:Response regulatory domain-containing protein n=2 Tax=Candidatus Woykeibacteriota TaxID=1817899 RepID=A0A1G1WXA7_9BACT|nr:MAG: hypothetical protein A3J50_03670 [Candidatus Woykebacteria bacterium RIFCSPHIGHO2_02_FULL_43_16b]OGY29833.1 MAG: hypothetical protein A3F33_00925 [Candidatus Woykebacteria bacterium RIFCSPHIGHO2_12_FULL_43_10]OGY32353.1 MAG: hypothetical protein A3A61_00015 [Candidatus Woykebacteria bacterium RIFCSPLOWO2_01_FULL_43_14]